jgi:hypothetical protein
MNVELLPHPRKVILSPAQFEAQTREGNFLVQRKYDGCLASVPLADAVILGELVQNKSGGFFMARDCKMLEKWPGGFFAAITVSEWHGANVLMESTAWRRGRLEALAPFFTADMILAETLPVGSAETARVLMTLGGEGFVAHDLTAPWAGMAGAPPMLCVKAGGIWPCRVTGHCGGTQSVFIQDAETGQPRGKVTLRGGKCDQARIGSIIRVEGLGLTAVGKIREPKPCREWLVDY